MILYITRISCILRTVALCENEVISGHCTRPRALSLTSIGEILRTAASLCQNEKCWNRIQSTPSWDSIHNPDWPNPETTTLY